MSDRCLLTTSTLFMTSASFTTASAPTCNAWNAVEQIPAQKSTPLKVLDRDGTHALPSTCLRHNSIFAHLQCKKHSPILGNTGTYCGWLALYLEQLFSKDDTHTLPGICLVFNIFAHLQQQQHCVSLNSAHTVLSLACSACFRAACNQHGNARFHRWVSADLVKWNHS